MKLTMVSLIPTLRKPIDYTQILPLSMVTFDLTVQDRGSCAREKEPLDEGPLFVKAVLCDASGVSCVGKDCSATQRPWQDVVHGIASWHDLRRQNSTSLVRGLHESGGAGSVHAGEIHGVVCGHVFGWTESWRIPWRSVFVGAESIQRRDDGEKPWRTNAATLKCGDTRAEKVYEKRSRGHVPVGVLRRSGRARWENMTARSWSRATTYRKATWNHCGDVAVRKTIRKYDYEEDYENTNEESIVMIVRS